MKSKRFSYMVRIGERVFSIRGLIWPPNVVFKDIPTESPVDYEILNIEQVSGEPWERDPYICGDGTFNDFIEMNSKQIERGIYHSFTQEAKR